MFTLRMLPAAHGDALWIEYGEGGEVHRVLVDGGPEPTHATLRSRIEALVPGERHFEALVITHVDADHIGGAVRYLEEGTDATFGDVWFNGRQHLTEVETLGPVQGERLSKWLVDHQVPWNEHFAGRAAVLPPDGDPPVCELPGGLRLTVLGPGRAQLVALAPEWDATIAKEGLVPTIPPEPRPETPEGVERLGPPTADEVRGWAAATPFDGDDTKPNGTSISLLAEFGGRTVLLTGDAHSDVLTAGIRRVLPDGQARLVVDAVKLPHHGSRANVDTDLLDVLDCRRFLFSSNGSHYGHPDREAVARVAVSEGEKELLFNYRTTFNDLWEEQTLREAFTYRTAYGDAPDGFLLDLSADG